MRTKYLIQDEYARENGYFSWIQLINDCALNGGLDKHINAVIDLVQKELLEGIAENISTLSEEKIHKAILNTPIL